jgi:hypothetical protein
MDFPEEGTGVTINRYPALSGANLQHVSYTIPGAGNRDAMSAVIGCLQKVTVCSVVRLVLLPKRGQCGRRLKSSWVEGGSVTLDRKEWRSTWH